MSGRVVDVIVAERYQDDDGPQLDVRVDKNDAMTAPHFADAGDDSCPLPGDFAAVVESDSSLGGEQITGYYDKRNAGVAEPGEKRIYSRSSDGAVVAAVYLRGDGSVLVSNDAGRIELAPGGDVTINGVVITASGEVRAPGEITAMAATPATAVSLSTHVHPTAVGPTSPPTGGT